MTSRQAKLGLKQGTLVVLPGRPPFPAQWQGKPLSAFQRVRLAKTYPAMKLYFTQGKTVIQIGAKLGVSYQRVEQILKLGLVWYEQVGWLAPTTSVLVVPGQPCPGCAPLP
jgi:hypothetical protein